MVLKRIYLFVSLLLVGANLIACSPKLAVPDSKTGVLVIPYRVSREVLSTEFDFDFWADYILKYSPATPVQIKIRPSIQKEYYIFDQFPPGKYWIHGIKTVVVPTQGLRTDKRQIEQAINGDTFEIKPGHITLLEHRLMVSTVNLGGHQCTQNVNFEAMDEKSKKGLVEKLKQEKNARLWKFHY